MEATEENKVGLLLASGFTKKEIAQKLGKSINTITKQSSRLYEKTGSHNLADLTRAMISRYTGLPIETVLTNAMHDLLFLFAVCFGVWAISQPEVIETIQTSLIQLFKK